MAAGRQKISRRGRTVRNSGCIGRSRGTLGAFLLDRGQDALHLTFSLRILQNYYVFRLAVNGRSSENAHRNFLGKPKVAW